MKKINYWNIYENLPNGERNLIAEKIPNRKVHDGVEFIEDFTWGISNWFLGAENYNPAGAASGVYTTERWVEMGISANTNDEALLGAGVTGIETGTWDQSGVSLLPSPEDSYCSSGSVSGIIDSIVRHGQVVTIEKTFNQGSEPNGIPNGTNIREMCCFIGEPLQGASKGDPSDDPSKRPYAMISRAVRYTTEAGYLKDNPITMGANPLTFQYVFGLE